MSKSCAYSNSFIFYTFVGKFKFLTVLMNYLWFFSRISVSWPTPLKFSKRQNLYFSRFSFVNRDLIWFDQAISAIKFVISRTVLELLSKSTIFAVYSNPFILFVSFANFFTFFYPLVPNFKLPNIIFGVPGSPIFSSKSF